MASKARTTGLSHPVAESRRNRTRRPSRSSLVPRCLRGDVAGGEWLHALDHDPLCTALPTPLARARGRTTPARSLRQAEENIKVNLCQGNDFSVPADFAAVQVDHESLDELGIAAAPSWRDSIFTPSTTALRAARPREHGRGPQKRVADIRSHQRNAGRHRLRANRSQLSLEFLLDKRSDQAKER